MSERFTHVLDPCGLHVVWDDERREPALLNGRMLMFTTLAGAKTFADVLNAAERDGHLRPPADEMPSQNRRPHRADSAGSSDDPARSAGSDSFGGDAEA